MSPPLRALPLALVLLACGKGGDDTSSDAPDGEEGDEACAVEPYTPVAGCLVVHALDFDADGRLLDYDSSWYDENGDLVSFDARNGEDYTDWIACTRTLAGAGMPATERCVGRSTYTYTWTYDAAGHLVSRSYDTASDGTLDKVWTYTVDADGHATHEDIDTDADGVANSTVDYTWAEGLLTEEAWDYDNNGVIDFRRSWTHEGGQIATEATDKDGDGAVDATVTFTRNADGQPLTRDEDADGDGAPDLSTTYAYVGCNLESALTTEVDSAPQRDSYRYDSEGRLIGHTADFGDNGQADSVDTWAWSCAGDEAP